MLGSVSPIRKNLITAARFARPPFDIALASAQVLIKGGFRHVWLALK